MEEVSHMKWNYSLMDPTEKRENKPRKSGLTMVMDKGLGLREYEDMLLNAAEYIDYIKLGFGTSALYPAEILKRKISLAQKHSIHIYPGGTFFEVAYVQGKGELYLEQLYSWGFQAIELSDGSTDITRQERNYWIKRAKQYDFHIITECGKKEAGSTLEIRDVTDTLFEDLEFGASYMIIEGRESGENVGIYNLQGEMDTLFIQNVMQQTNGHHSHMIWEAPKKSQQITFIQEVGPQVHLGNIASYDIYSLEALRRGLRSDTFTLK